MKKNSIIQAVAGIFLFLGVLELLDINSVLHLKSLLYRRLVELLS